MFKTPKEELYEQLLGLDNDITMSLDLPQKCIIVIVGGAGMLALGAITRRTQDIDALSVSENINDFLEARGVNTHVNAYFDYFPYNYEDRLVKIELDTSSIDFYTASLEDIVISKLHSPRDKDYNDITSEGTLSQINWDILHNIATNPSESNVLSDFRYREFLDKFKEYERKYRK